MTGFLAAVRQLVGPDVPIVTQLDIHSNVSGRMVEVADVIIGHETYPEIDQEDRGRECVEVLNRILREGLRPTMALHQLPLVWGMNQVTAHPPMRAAIELLHEIESRPGVVCGSIATCFPLADIPDMGASVYIVTDDDAVTVTDTCMQLDEDGTPGSTPGFPGWNHHRKWKGVLAGYNSLSSYNNPGKTVQTLPGIK